MTEYKPPASIAMVTEKAVRSAYKNSSPKQRYRLQWGVATPYERNGVWISLAVLIGCAASIFFISWMIAYMVFLCAIGLLGYCFGATERRAFGRHFQAYGDMLDTHISEPSRLRYLQFIEEVRSSDQVRVEHLDRLITAIEARVSYRDYFFRRYPVLTIVSAVIVMLVTSGLAQPMFWQTFLGLQLIAITVMLWIIALIIGRQWRALRPTPEAQERELLAFLHLAVIDLSDDEPIDA
ncbi:MAG: hypothetical protein AB8C95_12595 [Phycisphaeraceae bacterium]